MTIAGAAILSSTLGVTSGSNTAVLDVLATDPAFGSSVLTVRSSRGGSLGFKLIEALHSGSTSVFSVDGIGNIIASGVLNPHAASGFAFACLFIYIFHAVVGGATLASTTVSGTLSAGASTLSSLTVNGALVAGSSTFSSLTIGVVSNPPSRASGCVQGQLNFSTMYLYVCTSSNYWERIVFDSSWAP